MPSALAFAACVFLCVAWAQWSLLFSPVAQRAQKNGEKTWESGEEAIEGSKRVVRGGRFRPLDEPYEWCMHVLQA